MSVPDFNASDFVLPRGMTDTRTGTITVILTPQERRYLAVLVGHDWQVMDDKRMLSRPDSPQEKAAEADQVFIEIVQGKLRGG